MWINFTNLIGNDLERLLLGKEERESMSIMMHPSSLVVHEIEANDNKYWMVRVESNTSRDIKIHFSDKDKAQVFYELLCILISSDSQYTKIDVLDHGAL